MNKTQVTNNTNYSLVSGANPRRQYEQFSSPTCTETARRAACIGGACLAASSATSCVACLATPCGCGLLSTVPKMVGFPVAEVCGVIGGTVLSCVCRTPEAEEAAPISEEEEKREDGAQALDDRVRTPVEMGSPQPQPEPSALPQATMYSSFMSSLSSAANGFRSYFTFS